MTSFLRPHVFLSHASPDKPAVEAIGRKLREHGIEPWLDKWNLIPGQPWQPAIEEALAACGSCAVFFGPGGVGGWHNEEMRAAIVRWVDEWKKSLGAAGGLFPVIPVLLPHAPNPDSSLLPTFLKARTYVEFRSLDDPDALRRLIAGIRGLPPGAGPGEIALGAECPYRGLESFEEAHKRWFFGRDRATQDLVLKLRPAATPEGCRFLAILGASGSGKSSLAKAGLIPAIRAGEITGSDAWPIVLFRPGQNPVESLAEKLCTLPRAGSFASTIEDLSARENALHLAVRLALTDAPDGRRLVLVVDQFEEVFTLCPREHEPLRRAFLDNLLYAATIAGGRTVVILTMRADFYARCAAYPALAAALSEHQYLVGPMTRDELRDAIEQPAVRSGAEFDQGLVDDLLDEVVDRPAALPMLEFALMRLWDRRDGRRLTHAAYNAMKGLEGALAQRADEVLAALDPAQRDVCRRVFLRLTQPGEGTEDTRRRAPLAELVPAGADPAAVESVVKTLADARLVRTGDAVEVVHEALLRGWPALRTWLDADRQGHLTYLGLVARAREWDQHARTPGLLDTGARLAAAREWGEKHPGELDPLPLDFLAAGLAAEHAEKERRDAEALRLARAEADAQREAAHRAEEWASSQRRLAKVRGYSVIVIALLLAFSLWATYLAREEFAEASQATLAALQAEEQAQAEARHARTSESEANKSAEAARKAEEKAQAEARHANALRLAAQANSRQRDQLDLGLLLGVEAHRFEANYETFTTLFAGSRTNPRLMCYLHGHKDSVSGVAFGRDGNMLASASGDGTILLWDAKTGRARGEPLAGHKGPVYGASFSPDGKTLASASGDGTVILWDVETGRVRGEPLAGHKGPVYGASFSPDGRTLASASYDKTVILWDVETGRARGEPLAGHKGPVYGASFSPDGRTLASASYDKTVILWDVETARVRGEPLAGHKGPVYGASFSPDGRTLASASYDGTVILWDAETGRQRGEPLAGHKAGVSGVAFGQDGKTMASASNDGMLILWDLDIENSAIRRAGRNLTQAEWDQYIGKGVPYRRTSELYPPGEGAVEGK